MTHTASPSALSISLSDQVYRILPFIFWACSLLNTAVAILFLLISSHCSNPCCRPRPRSLYTAQSQELGQQRTPASPPHRPRNRFLSRTESQSDAIDRVVQESKYCVACHGALQLGGLPPPTTPRLIYTSPRCRRSSPSLSLRTRHQPGHKPGHARRECRGQINSFKKCPESSRLGWQTTIRQETATNPRHPNHICQPQQQPTTRGRGGCDTRRHSRLPPHLLHHAVHLPRRLGKTWRRGGHRRKTLSPSKQAFAHRLFHE